MKMQNSFYRTLACALLLCFAATLVPTPTLAESPSSFSPADSTSMVHGENADLYALSIAATTNGGENSNRRMFAAQHRTGEQADTSMQKGDDRDCCGGFWEIHFGGYRWAWWALAGAGLIAIHSN